MTEHMKTTAEEISNLIHAASLGLSPGDRQRLAEKISERSQSLAGVFRQHGFENKLYQLSVAVDAFRKERTDGYILNSLQSAGASIVLAAQRIARNQ